MSDNNLGYLVAAYSLFFIGIALYVRRIARLQGAVEEELRELRERLKR